MPVDDSGAQRHASQMLERIREAVRVASLVAADVVVVEALARTPTVDREYDILMQGENGGASPVPRSGDQSADTDGRTRLSKLESTYLANVVPSPLNRSYVISSEHVGFRFGNMPLLEASTVFSYTNKTSDGPKTYTLGPYFMNWEYGSIRTVSPVGRRHSDGGYYPLRPDETSTLKSMDKSVAPKGIFLGPLLLEAFANTFQAELQALGPVHRSH